MLSETNKVLLDVKEGGNSLVYLPLDQLVNKKQAGQEAKAAGQAMTPPAAASEQGQAPKKDTRDSARERRER